MCGETILLFSPSNQSSNIIALSVKQESVHIIPLNSPPFLPPLFSPIFVHLSQSPLISSVNHSFHPYFVRPLVVSTLLVSLALSSPGKRESTSNEESAFLASRLLVLVVICLIILRPASQKWKKRHHLRRGITWALLRDALAPFELSPFASPCRRIIDTRMRRSNYRLRPISCGVIFSGKNMHYRPISDTFSSSPFQ